MWGVNARDVFFLRIRHPNFHGLGVGGGKEGVPAYLTLSGDVFSNHASGLGVRTHNMFLCVFGYSIFMERGAVIGAFGGSLALAAALLVCMPADSNAMARFFFIFFAPASRFSRTVGVGKKGCRYLIALCGGTRPARGSWASDRCIFPFTLPPFYSQGLDEGR